MTKPIRVRDFMSASTVTFTPDTSVMDAIHSLVTHRVSGAPVVDDRGNVVGVLSERDCLAVTLQSSYHSERSGKVADFMSQQVKTVDSNDSIVDLASMFLKAPYRRYPVMHDNRLVGVISRRDVLRALLETANPRAPGASGARSSV